MLEFITSEHDVAVGGGEMNSRESLLNGLAHTHGLLGRAYDCMLPHVDQVVTDVLVFQLNDSGLVGVDVTEPLGVFFEMAVDKIVQIGS